MIENFKFIVLYCIVLYCIVLYIRKPAGSPRHPAACLPAVGMSPTRSSLSGLFRARVKVLDIKPLMITANLTLGEVIWLLFELVLIVLRTRTDKTAVTYIEFALFKPPFF